MNRVPLKRNRLQTLTQIHNVQNRRTITAAPAVNLQTRADSKQL